MADLRHYTSPMAEAFPGFSHAVADGRYVFLSGQIAGDSKAPDARQGTIEDETRTSLASLRAMLRDLGLGMEDVLKVNIYMKDLGEFERMERVYATFFPEGRRPARTTIGAGDLLFGARIEIDCIARMD
ncbi:MAG TPA: RidA family protein [Alphaproteobacteria bacterium]|nr:RidA family protein [Alphaproteobacteria bacterium]